MSTEKTPTRQEEPTLLTPHTRVALLQHEGVRDLHGKTGKAMLRYGDFPIVAVVDAETAGQSLHALTGIDRDVPIVASVQDALAYKPEVLVIGIAPSGGMLPEPWREEVKVALRAGLSLVNGLHNRMADEPELQTLLAPSARIWDVRQEPKDLGIGSGAARQLPCKRVLAVGTDMAVGKMSACLELHRLAKQRGLRSGFLATGQTGIMLSGQGIALDSIRVDFAAGAVESAVCKAAAQQEILFVEGQGSLCHPGSTATLPLLRGTQPTHLLLVHRATQTHLDRVPSIQIPPLPKVIELYEMTCSAGGAFPHARVSCIALNTCLLSEQDALLAISQTSQDTGLPCADPVRFSPSPLLDALLTD